MTIGVNLTREHHYEIKVEYGLLAKQNFRRFKASKIAVVTDPVIRKLHGKKLEELLRNQEEDFIFIEIPRGEKGKTQFQAEKIRSRIAKEGFDRYSMIFCFGGGSIGDTAGFAATRHLRGIRYVQIPTTLLAMIDSSIGGKVGVNTSEGKNMDGAFYQPIKVISDTSLLETLPIREWRNGLAEIVKYAVISDSQLFDLLMEYPNPAEWSRDLTPNIIRRCSTLKKDVVEDDELETKGTREILNYGHTIGHAIEKVSGYRIPHGAAVGIGMRYEAGIALELGLLKKSEYDGIIILLKKTGLFDSYNGNENKLICAMRKDKKNKNEEIWAVLPIEIGAAARNRKQYSLPIKEDIIRKVLRKVN